MAPIVINNAGNEKTSFLLAVRLFAELKQNTLPDDSFLSLQSTYFHPTQPYCNTGECHESNKTHTHTILYVEARL